MEAGNMFPHLSYPLMARNRASAASRSSLSSWISSAANSLNAAASSSSAASPRRRMLPRPDWEATAIRIKKFVPADLLVLLRCVGASVVQVMSIG